MSKILVLITPADGHVNPFLPVLNELKARGHEVVCIAGKRFKDKVESTGAVFSPYPVKWDFSEGLYEFFPHFKEVSGSKQGKLYFKLTYDVIPDVVSAAQEILKTFDADIVLYDSFQRSGVTLTELGGPPCIAVSVLPLYLRSPGIAPSGLGLLPSRNFISRLRNHFLSWLVEAVVFRDIKQFANRQRKTMQLPLLKGSLLSYDTLAPTQFLYMCAPSLEYPRSNLPANFEFVGTVKLHPKPDYQPPRWWSELTKNRPVILINQGTVAKDLDDLIKPAIEALKDLNVTVVAVPVENPSQLGTLPSNTFVAPYIPFGNLLPHVDIMIANGGFGATQNALAHGIPVVVGGATEDKMEVAARVEYSGAGINLRTQKPTAESIVQAVKTILAQPSYQQNARRLQAEYVNYDPATLTVDYVEAMIAKSGNRAS